MDKELGIIWDKVLIEKFQVQNKYLPEDIFFSSFSVQILVESLCELSHKYKCVTNAVDFKICTN